MKISAVTSYLENIASTTLQEHYDNAGLLTGDPAWECTGILCSLDATEVIVKEAIEKKCNLIVAHHPIIFGGLKKINGKNYVEKTIIAALKNDIAIYAIHTNLDNVMHGVNGRIADKLNLKQREILLPKENTLKKLYTFAPSEHAAKVRDAIFEAGGGHIGNYSECSFNAEGAGTFKAGEGADPFVGNVGEQHHETEIKIEIIFPSHLESGIIRALRSAHPYEEVAFDIVPLANKHGQIGSGLVGVLETGQSEKEFLENLKQVFGTPVIRHSSLRNRAIKKVAICGGAGSFLISRALSHGVDAYVTADMKYHEFFDANDRLLIADVGHYESEQFTVELLAELLEQKFPTFAVLKTAINTNPVHYC